MAGFEPIREVRFGLVMYGGVSLAVYINGVAQELYNLVRATAPKLDDEFTLHHGDDELRGTEHVYRELGRRYGEPAGPVGDVGTDVAAVQPVRTRFVVDIISGSSAGGINGIYLGKALANQQDFSSLRGLWITKGDVGALLNDGRTRKPRKDRLPDKEPAEALFSGDVMYLELLDALDAMDDGRPSVGPDDAPPSPYVEELDVWITATDLAGTAMPLRLADAPVLETKHRHTFHFVYGEAQAEGGRHNDFGQSTNPLLAFAARATSAFPFAFVPARLADIRRVYRKGAVKARCDPLAEAWKPWFANQRETAGFDYQNVSFGDGGDMDNKPFGWVIDTLPARTSSTPVDRRLLYVEPDPGDPTERPGQAADRPDVIGSTIAAVMLGRVEAIRDDIERLAKVSEVRARIGGVTRAIDHRYAVDKMSEALETSTEDWLAEGRDAMKARGLTYAAYYSLRVDMLTTEYARSLVGLPWHAAETPESAAMRAIVATWVAVAYSDPYRRARGAQPTTKWWLRNFDIAYRIRRLAFVAGEADRLYREEGASDEFRDEARRIKAALGRAEKALRLWVPSVRSNPSSTPRVIVLDPADVKAFTDAADPVAGAGELWTKYGGAMVGEAAKIAEFLRAVFRDASTAVKAALQVDGDGGGTSTEPRVVARRSVLDYYLRFDDFDQVTFPLHVAAGSTGELDEVQVHRISPRDATSLVNPSVRPKVAGSRLGHFGGFLDARWRANDIMWGRLDTAERLLCCLLPGGDTGARDELLARAHDAILAEEWYVDGRGGAKHLGDARAADPSPGGACVAARAVPQGLRAAAVAGDGRAAGVGVTGDAGDELHAGGRRRTARREAAQPRGGRRRLVADRGEHGGVPPGRVADARAPRRIDRTAARRGVGRARHHLQLGRGRGDRMAVGDRRRAQPGAGLRGACRPSAAVARRVAPPRRGRRRVGRVRRLAPVAGVRAMTDAAAAAAAAVPANPWLSRRVIGFAHQGGALEGPPGTIEAMTRALSNGAAALEFDLHLSRDGALVVHHDRVLVVGERSLRIADSELSALRSLLPDLATLDDVLRSFPRVPLTVEIKAKAAAEPAARMLADRAVGTAGPLIVTAFSPSTVAAVRRAAPSLDTAPGWPTILLFWLASRVGVALPLRARGVVALQVSLDLQGVAVVKKLPFVRALHVADRRLVNAAHRRSLAVHVWTLNDEPSIHAALSAGADGVFTDRPSVLTAVLDAAGQRWRSDVGDAHG
jgi:patatin-related protein